MIKSTNAAIFFDDLLNTLHLIKAGEIQRDRKTDLTLEKTYEALVETMFYIKIAKIQHRNHQKEQELINLWRDAGFFLQHLDQGLSQACQPENGYWTNPDAWGDIRSGNATTGLESVEKLTYELLSA